MGKIAMTIQEQINLLQSRGMIIDDIEKASEVLLDVGYYRLGFYWFPFEVPCQKGSQRTHEFNSGTNFNDAVKLYYFDYALRTILLKYINRIEVNFRTYMVYYVSNVYKTCPTWFVSPNIVSKQYISSFDKEVYTPKFRRTKVIAAHHRNHINDRYAPAWKVLEFMTLGSNVLLYKSLLDLEVQKKISAHFGVKYTSKFENYMEVITCLRNTCAHGGVLYDLALHPVITKGPANVSGDEYSKLHGAIKVVRFLLQHVSINRVNDFDNEIEKLLQKYMVSPALKEVLATMSGFPMQTTH
jgi:abortive infection bacteriophage resistance protein